MLICVDGISLHEMVCQRQTERLSIIKDLEGFGGKTTIQGPLRLAFWALWARLLCYFNLLCDLVEVSSLFWASVFSICKVGELL